MLWSGQPEEAEGPHRVRVDRLDDVDPAGCQHPMDLVEHALHVASSQVFDHLGGEDGLDTLVRARGELGKEIGHSSVEAEPPSLLDHADVQVDTDRTHA